MSRSAPAVASLLLGVVVVVPAAAVDEGQAVLVRCESRGASLRVRETAIVLADHLESGYSASHPSAVVMARSMANVSATLDRQLEIVEPALMAFRDAWTGFDEAVRRSPLPRDPALGPVLRGYRRNAGRLVELLGCEAPADGSGWIPCSAIPIAHLLSVVGDQVHSYVEERYAGSLPESVAAAGDLAAAIEDLHHLLHDLEIAVPATRLTFAALAASLEGSALTDTDEPEDLEVRSRLGDLGEEMAALDGLVGSCHEAAEAHGHS